MTDTRARAEQIAGGHYECDDSWYSCPLSTDGCADKRQEGCTCGRDRLVQQIDAALADERRRAQEEAAKICDERAKYYKSIKSVGDIHDSIAERLADEIRAKAQAGPEEGQK